MDAVAALKEVEIPLIIVPTTKDIFVPLLEAHREQIESVRRQTFAFGMLDRQKLDIYYPSADSLAGLGNGKAQKAPILVFVYGGGFSMGDRQLPPPFDLGYVNLGAFFAKRGYVVVIPDYRLVPGAKFPEPVEDIRDAILWVLEHPQEVNKGAAGVIADTENIFVMGHSAGACHTATLALYPSLLSPHVLKQNIRGLILKGGAYIFPADLDESSPTLLLYGTPQAAHDNMPLTLLERGPESTIAALPDMLFLMSEREPQVIKAMNERFVEAFRQKTGREEVGLSLMKGHNHISPHWCLGTGEGEEWAVEVDEWIKQRVGKKEV